MIPATSPITITPSVEASRLIPDRMSWPSVDVCSCAQRAAAASRSESASLRRTSRASRDTITPATVNTSSASVSASPVATPASRRLSTKLRTRVCSRISSATSAIARRSLTRRSTAAEARHAAAPATVAMISRRATGSTV